MDSPSRGAWKKIRSEPGPDLILFRSRFDWMVNTRNGKPLKTIILEARDCVNIVALTPEGKLVAVSQFRFGAGRFSLEIPAGLADPGEEPLDAARRELEEETGYLADDWTALGWSFVDPAFLNNRAHTFLARGARRISEPQPDESEDLEVVELSLAEARQAIREERMRNSLTLLALSKVFDLRENAA